MVKRKVVICTVGTSLFTPNLSSLSKKDEPHSNLYKAYLDKAWETVADALLQLNPNDRICGAEINSITSLIDEGLIEDEGTVHLCHSSTQDGRDIAVVIEAYYRKNGWQVTKWEIDGLQDEDPKKFRTSGLRNLAKNMFSIINESGSPDFCAINATGGYKAQIAIAVLAGQAIGIPVYYKHERFPIIISLPPLPVSFDFRYWTSKSGLLLAIEREGCVKAAELEEDWDEKMESLVERVSIDGDDYIELSALGAIFLEAFRKFFRDKSQVYLPPEVQSGDKKPVQLPDHDWGQFREPVRRFLQKIVDVVPYVKEIHTSYLNPDLPSINRFHINAGGEIEGVFSRHGKTAKFIVFTGAEDETQREAAVADLNLRLEQGVFGRANL